MDWKIFEEFDRKKKSFQIQTLILKNVYVKGKENNGSLLFIEINKTKQ